MKAAVKLTTAEHVRVFPHPLTAGPYPRCGMCSWVWRPDMGGEAGPFVLKVRNRWCRTHRERWDS